MFSIMYQRQIAENRFVPDCSGVVTARAFVTVNLLIGRFEMSVYYYLLSWCRTSETAIDRQLCFRAFSNID